MTWKFIDYLEEPKTLALRTFFDLLVDLVRRIGGRKSELENQTAYISKTWRRIAGSQVKGTSIKGGEDC